MMVQNYKGSLYYCSSDLTFDELDELYITQIMSFDLRTNNNILFATVALIYESFCLKKIFCEKLNCLCLRY